MQRERDDPGGDSAVDKVRLKYLKELYKKVDRNIICYYSGYLSKPRVDDTAINDEDKNGLMLCVDDMEKGKGLDLFIHTPGGDGAATASIIHYLREMFGNNIRAFVPQIAMSAGTILALSCKEIFMGKHSNLGPVDPQVNGLPAYGVLAEVERAYKEIVGANDKAWVWNPILSNHNPSFLQRCLWATEAAHELVTDVLKQNMLADLPKADRDIAAETIYSYLAEFSSSQGHDKHLHYKELIERGIRINMLEDKTWKSLQDPVLTVHHCFMYTFANTPAVKIIENQLGRRWIKLLTAPQSILQFNVPPEMMAELGKELTPPTAPRGPPS
jgi:hypothetical protein